MQEAIRLLKLFYFSVVEHVRSNDSTKSWADAHEMVEAFSTEAETMQFLAEFGKPQAKNARCRALRARHHNMI